MSDEPDVPDVPDALELLPRARRVRELLRVTGPVDLNKIDPARTVGLPEEAAPDGKRWARVDLGRLGPALASRQERLYAGAAADRERRRVLLVLQAMDCGGKDGTVKCVVGALNPLGVRVTAFGPPTADELAHHFLWRVNRALPPAGQVGVFNRSHYEDVLAVRVRSLAPEATWRPRYEQINQFEGQLVSDGQTFVKIMLHISYEEQRRRLLARLDDPTKRWKFRSGDIDDRELWPEYQAAYADMLARCSPSDAPWYVVPADRKWYRNWAVANILLAHLDDLELAYPQIKLDVKALRGRLESGSRGKRKMNKT